MSSPDAPALAPAQPWSLAQRVGFRFAFAYIVIRLFPFPINLIPGTSWGTQAYSDLWDPIVLAVGKHVLRIGTAISTGPSHSGDTTYDWVQHFCYLALAILAAVVWSIADRRRTEYAKLHEGLRILVRYWLGFTMVSYGVAKFTQFPGPTTDTLIQPYGEASPMGLLWTFMGHSSPYKLFTGVAETLGGCLLLFRRTTTLGALVLVGVLSNVVLLNFCYDVPVKLGSAHLLLSALFLLLPDLERLASVLVLNRPTQPAAPRKPFEVKWQERAWIIAKFVLIGATVIPMMVTHVKIHQHRSAFQHPFQGIYEVESFKRDGQEVSLLLTDVPRWRIVAVNQYGGMTVRMMNDSVKEHVAEDDPEKKTLSLSSGPDPKAPKIVLAYSRPDPAHLLLEGTHENAALSVRLRKADASKSLLVNRGFHWVNEVPFNR
jgi:uncharacterized membrane protein YphA (DoxX/SURF4 family)